MKHNVRMKQKPRLKNNSNEQLSIGVTRIASENERQECSKKLTCNCT
jgi:hypothetical protein